MHSSQRINSNLTQIEKDVLRCDRNHPYFSQHGNLMKLCNVMSCFVWEHPGLDYVQVSRFCRASGYAKSLYISFRLKSVQDTCLRAVSLSSILSLVKCDIVVSITPTKRKSCVAMSLGWAPRKS